MEGNKVEHRFEEWYNKKINCDDAKEIFSESCKCYKVGAYRAAFLLVYLGFQIILKERLLKSPKEPNGINGSYWDDITGKLRDDNQWDEQVTKAVEMKKPARIFLISEDIKEQYLYFRRIRNVCAHAKDNIINYSHIDTFVLFMQSHINKFIINGGIDGLMERIKRHYDPSFTKRNSDVSPIVEDIRTSMDVSKIPEFLMDAYNFFDKEGWLTPFDKWQMGSDFWEAIIRSSDDDLVKAFYTFVKRDWNVFFGFIDSYPERLIYSLDTATEEFRRNFWYDKILQMFKGAYYENRWVVLKTLLSSGIIPEEEKEDMLKRIVNTKQTPPEDTVDSLKSTDYFKLLRDSIFGSGTNFNSPDGIQYGNFNWSRIKFLIANVDLDDDIVLQLNRALSYASFGAFYEGFKDLLLGNAEIRENYIRILTSNGSTIPDCIKTE